MKMIKRLLITSAVCLLLILPQSISGADGKFQIELYNGYASINPSDLNLLPQSDTLLREFYFPRHLEWLHTSNYIAAWSGETGGEYKELKHGFPLGLRLKYHLNPTLAISVGFRSLSRTEESTPSYEYIQSSKFSSYLDKRTYEQYRLSARGTAAMLGIHLKTRARGRLSFEAHAAAGPLFARCNYVSQWNSEFTNLFISSTPVLFTESGSLTQEGDGTGIAIDAGVRVNISLGRSFGLFLGAGYAYQSVNNISGVGREDRNGQITDWDGKWRIKTETLSASWGQQLIIFPTSYWPEDDTAPGETFKLDLSGFQLQVGIYIRF